MPLNTAIDLSGEDLLRLYGPTAEYNAAVQAGQAQFPQQIIPWEQFMQGGWQAPAGYEPIMGPDGRVLGFRPVGGNEAISAQTPVYMIGNEPPPDEDFLPSFNDTLATLNPATYFQGATVGGTAGAVAGEDISESAQLGGQAAVIGGGLLSLAAPLAPEAAAITTTPLAPTVAAPVAAAPVAAAAPVVAAPAAGAGTAGTVAGGAAAGVAGAAVPPPSGAPAPTPTPTGYNPTTTTGAILGGIGDFVQNPSQVLDQLGSFVTDPSAAAAAFMASIGGRIEDFLANPGDYMARFGDWLEGEGRDFLSGSTGGGTNTGGGISPTALLALLGGVAAGSALGGDGTQTSTATQVTGASPLLAGTDPLSMSVQSALNRQLTAADLQNNPYMAAYLEAALRPTRQYFEESLMPSIASEAITAGGFGGSRQGVAEGLAARGLAQAEGDVTARLLNDFYRQGLSAEQTGITLAGGLRAGQETTRTLEAETNPILGAITGLQLGTGILAQMRQADLIGSPDSLFGEANGPFALGLLGLLGALGANP